MNELHEADKLDAKELDNVVKFFTDHPTAFGTVVDKVEKNKRRMLKDDDLLRVVATVNTIRVNSSVLSESLSKQYDEIVVEEIKSFIASLDKKIKDLFKRESYDDIFPPEYNNSSDKEFTKGHGEGHVLLKKSDVGD